MSKLPFMQFYPADWLQDTSCLSLEAQGAWMRLICAMWVAPERGKLDWTLDQFQNFLGLHRVDATEVWNELQSSGVGECDFHDGPPDPTPPGVPNSTLSTDRVTLVCRRIRREEIKRNQTCERVKRHRTQNVTQKKRRIYHTSEVRGHIADTTNPPIVPRKRGTSERVVDMPFERFWAQYPKKVGKAAAYKQWCIEAKHCIEVQEGIFTALDWQISQPQWTRDGGQYIPNPSTYLHQKRWLDQKVEVSDNGRAEPKSYDSIRQFIAVRDSSR